MAERDPFGARSQLLPGIEYYRLERLVELGHAEVPRLPVTVRILLENLLRNAGGPFVEPGDVIALASVAGAEASAGRERAFLPSRVLLQDLTGVPCIVDMAAMRSAAGRAGADPGTVDALVPADLVVDHSVQVDAFGSAQAYGINVRREYERNRERYTLLRWAQQSFNGFRVVPPGRGIVHQVNLEYLARVVEVRDDGGDGVVAFPDTVVGTDSHTTMVNGIGVLGWGVGGIEAESVMLGQPLLLLPPVVVGVRLLNALPAGTTATDLVLTLTERLRRHGVVNRFVEFCGAGLSSMSAADRATLSNMAPEYGATAALFPVDDQTLAYLRASGRDEAHVALVERYHRAQGMFRLDAAEIPLFSELVELDLADVVPSVAGPRRPQDRVALADVWGSFVDVQGGLDLAPPAPGRLAHGSVVIAAITSCTNTSNPSVMIGAGLLAQKAVERGLSVPAHVKTTLAPGSRVVSDYLERAGLLAPLSALGFDLVGYGCTTCIGNSGPLDDDVARQVEQEDLSVVAVLSGNRNFEGRIHPQVRAAYLASPPLVVAYALAGTVRPNLSSDALGIDREGCEVFLRDLWPSAEEVDRVMRAALGSDLFDREYSEVFEGDEQWRSLPVPEGSLYAWDAASTYVREPPFLLAAPIAPDPASPEPGREEGVIVNIAGARILVLAGDSVTTDHISPAGSISPQSPAGRYLVDRGVAPRDFNTYGARRGNHEVMVRGTFANPRLRNLLAGGVEGGVTTFAASGEVMSIYDAATHYAVTATPLMVIAGREYGSGSSRDWAAKGTSLLGVRVVIAESYERIHRGNLLGMGVLPLQFQQGDTATSLGLTGRELYSVTGTASAAPSTTLHVVADGGRDSPIEFDVWCRLDSATEVGYFAAGGLLPLMLGRFIGETRPAPEPGEEA